MIIKITKIKGDSQDTCARAQLRNYCIFFFWRESRCALIGKYHYATVVVTPAIMEGERILNVLKKRSEGYESVCEDAKVAKSLNLCACLT